ncbi:HPP family protein [Micromonospora olivasterospora]|uniref:HPP family protein n=1 Tax=Micromonospora olivasterospora TaxID=1880 RepID=A0A562I5P5_MICOL|nr:HPP family protein [Micromonospora olivasterospora]TWH66078.1 HPP family protein [Micromonospora olivasterospora]
MPPEIDEPSSPASRGVRAFGGAAVAVVVAGAVALLTRQPWLFPSLGPAIMLHVEQPEKPESSPRNTVIGHLVALLAGYALLAATGLAGRPSALQEGVTGLRIVAAAGSLAVTALVLVLLKAAHPPAGATTLIVSLGLLHTPGQLIVAAGAVVLVTLVDLLFNRATGRDMPLWRAPGPAPRKG